MMENILDSISSFNAPGPPFVQKESLYPRKTHIIFLASVKIQRRAAARDMSAEPQGLCPG